MGLAPIIFQYGTEVAYPAKEGTSLGLMLLGGQISGVLFVFLFEMLHGLSNSVVVPMLIIVAVTIIQIPLGLSMNASNTIPKTQPNNTLN